MHKVGIIGVGFSGTMVVVHLIRNSKVPFELHLINEKNSFNKGFAYNPYSKLQLLNVTVSKMSAFKNEPDHFLNWILRNNFYKNVDVNILANSFLPRYLYGKYLSEIWEETMLLAKSKKITVNYIDSIVTDLDISDGHYSLQLINSTKIEVDFCLIASGNHLPRNPEILNKHFFTSSNYFQNPWNINSVINVPPGKPVLIIGNGLTMVDTVLGFLEHGFENEIFAISPNGFNILPHRHKGINYTTLVEELPESPSLFDLLKLFNKHIKLLRSLGLSAEPIIDSVRPLTQKLWQNTTAKEKKLFMSRLRHLWGVARHRIPLHIYDKIQALRIENILHIYPAKLIDIIEKDGKITVYFFNKKTNRNEEIAVSRVINCTGPETDLLRLEKNFLKNCLLKGIVSQDELKLGINADTNTFEIINSSGKKQKNLFTIGTHLKGMLWETTAVNELRDQAEMIATNILNAAVKK